MKNRYDSFVVVIAGEEEESHMQVENKNKSQHHDQNGNNKVGLI